MHHLFGRNFTTRVNRLLKNVFSHDPEKEEDIGRTLFAYFLLPVALVLAVQKTAISTFVKNHSQFALAAILILALLYLLLIFRALLSVNQRSRMRTASYGASGNVAMANLTILLTALYIPISFLDLASGRTGDAYVPAPSNAAMVAANTNPQLQVDSGKPTGITTGVPTGIPAGIPQVASQIILQGDIGIGASSRLGELLGNSDSLDRPITRLVLSSDGGNIFEARGIAKLVREHQLDTHAMANCLSACTLIFVSGENRSASANTRFGFHAYRLDARYPDVWININEQQTLDKELFLSRGVNESFVENIYANDPSTLWTPSLDVLVEAGFLHQYK